MIAVKMPKYPVMQVKCSLQNLSFQLELVSVKREFDVSKLHFYALKLKNMDDTFNKKTSVVVDQSIFFITY
jgi:hypothetical protein